MQNLAPTARKPIKRDFAANTRFKFVFRQSLATAVVEYCFVAATHQKSGLLCTHEASTTTEIEAP